MTIRILFRSFAIIITGVVIYYSSASVANAQAKETPLTNQELVRMVYELPARPEKVPLLVEEIRRRGIGFPLTDGIRSLVATKSGNDATLRRTLEEAERRRQNPAGSSLPPEAEGLELLEQTKTATLAAANGMPDFVVKQLISRAYARGNSSNWLNSDSLAVAVSYRASAGEEYRLLTVNGMPPGIDAKDASSSYEQVGGTSSTGEYVSLLAALFTEESRAMFQMVDTDTLRGRRTIVYEFVVQRPYSKQSIKADGQSVIVGYRGRIWVDREEHRVLRIEDVSTEIARDFPVTASSSVIDYDWVTISDQKYLLPVRAEVQLTGRSGPEIIQTRNIIRFRGYQKYGSEVKIIEEDIVEDPPEPAKKP